MSIFGKKTVLYGLPFLINYGSDINSSFKYLGTGLKDSYVKNNIFGGISYSVWLLENSY